MIENCLENKEIILKIESLKENWKKDALQIIDLMEKNSNLWKNAIETEKAKEAEKEQMTNSK